ncbi:phenylacetate-CoA oxygenase subunit PaaC [Acidimicrobiaceae bacterium AH-315-P05]|nr:phenylacetate-CoA oxygenase subunit PaaC [Acidimicrobiaceae bacterium AH-315-P05]
MAGRADQSKLLRHVLRHGDRALVLAQRLGQCITHGPEIEEDVALANISLDLIGQARHLYTYAGTVEGLAHDEDHFAYWRDADEFLNPLLVEQPNGDFAHTMVRQFFHDAYAIVYWESMRASTDSTLAALAVRAHKETSFHLRHSRGWVTRLGDGTAESHRRTQEAVDALWGFTGELASNDDESEFRMLGLIGEIDLGERWVTTIEAALSGATLQVPTDVSIVTGGWDGQHSEHLAPLVAELQSVARAHQAGAKW